LDETTSTNDDAKRGASEGAPHGDVWIAESQTKGRGRRGRAWLSAPGENLLFSVLLRMHAPPQNLPLVALAAGLAAHDAIAKSVPRARIKWPNDVVVDRKKIAGVLVESANNAVVVGIGINVHSTHFPPEISPFATSVACEKGNPDRAALLMDTLFALDRDAPIVAARGLAPIHARLCERDAVRGERVEHDGRTGVAEGIDQDGRLLVRFGVAIERITSGEVNALVWRSPP